jgi:hypothetical protein
MNASIYAYDVVRGAILILAMLMDSLTSRINARRALAAVAPGEQAHPKPLAPASS